MNLLPIINRELRAEARHPVNYALRGLGALTLTSVLGFFLWRQPSAQSGDVAFRVLSFLIFGAIWIVVPLLTADCLSREKREGTLGLLFLTPLQPIEIILGKGAIHAIRSLTLIVAGIPILTIPFILGGITKANVVGSLLLDAVALLGALAAGLLASSLCRRWTRAVLLAELFAFLFFLGFLRIAMASHFLSWGATGNLFSQLSVALQYSFFSMRYNLPGQVSMVSSAHLTALFSTLLGSAAAVFSAAILLASRRLKKTWQENPPSPKQLWLQKVFCTPMFWTELLRRRNQAQLSNNPIGWLQQYSWSARLGKWGWCGVVITFVSWFLANNYQMLSAGCSLLKTGLLLSMAFSAVGSFQREKQNGALELLLVAPLRENQIILGRLRGIWGQFLPAFIILITSVVMVRSGFSSSYFSRHQPLLLNWVAEFVVVPIVGLYCAMRWKNFLFAWGVTCAVTLLLPWLVTQFLAGLLFSIGWPRSYDELSILWLVLVGKMAHSSLQTGLKNRSFALGHV